MIITHTGKYFDYQNITKDNIDIDDIITALPRLNRFVGHSDRAYSVGEHTIYCYKMAKKLGYSTRERLLTFIHDFTEAYVGDCPAPLKKLLPEFERIEEKTENAICEYLGIEPPTEEEYLKIKKIDLTMLLIEMRDLTKHNYQDYINEFTYTEFLDDEEFVLSKNNADENEIRELLKFLFILLMENYRKEYFKEG